jgi:hypothetical protein
MALVLLLALAQGKLDPAKVDEAVARGVKHLKPHAAANQQDLELTLLALVHGGVGPNDPAFADALDRALKQDLAMTYRVALLAAGDLSFAAAKCYDLEVWAPGENRWLEVSSCSNFEDFQARRAQIRFRPAKGAKPEFVHTLNGSGVALSRSLAALLENHQTERGTVRIPEALVPFVDGIREILPG